MRLKEIILVVLIMTSMLMVSCKGGNELEDLGIATTTGIDMLDNQLILTHEVIVPKSSTTNRNRDESNVQYVQSSGDTVLDALRNATLTFERKLYLSHNRVIILGEEFARRGINDLMNFYVSDNEPRESTFLIVAKDANAYEVMGVNGGLSQSPGEYLFDLFENYSVNLKSRKFTMGEYIRYFLQGENVVLPIVQKVEQTEIDKTEEDKSTKKALEVTGGAVFHKDKLIGYYDGDEMKGFNFIVDEFKNGLIVFEVSDDLVKNNKFMGVSGKYTVVEVKKSDTKARIELIDNKLNFKIDVMIKGILIEDTKGLNISDKEILNSIRTACSNKVEEYITKTMDKAQDEFKVDSFGISNFVHIKYPSLWREISDEWESIFPDLEYEVSAEVELIRTGLTNMPINIKLEENRIKENK